MRERSGAARKERLRSVFEFASEAARATEQAALFLRCIHPLRFDERKDLDEECTRYDAFLKEKRKNAVVQSRNGLRLLLAAAGADALLFAFRAVRRLLGHRPLAEIMPEGGDRLLLLERFAADETLAALGEARFRTSRSLCGHRFGRAQVEPHARRKFLFCGRVAKPRLAAILFRPFSRLPDIGEGAVCQIFGARRKVCGASSSRKIALFSILTACSAISRKERQSSSSAPSP